MGAKASQTDVDYAATADAMVDSDSDAEEQETLEQKPAPETDEKCDDDDDDDESTENEEESDDDGSGDDEEDQEDKQEINRSAESNRIASSITGEGEEPCSFDLRNLLAMNTHTIDTSSLYTTKKNQANQSATIPPLVNINEDYLLQKAQSGCQQLMTALWKLPNEQSDVGELVTLPTIDESRLPRSLPLPAPKQETKWEKFAKSKGIGVNQSKRSRKVWDEDTKEWKYRTGYQKASNKNANWPILEANAEDPYADPWQAQREEHKSRVRTNTQQRLKNVERSGGIAKGTTNRLLAGVPVDLQPAGRKGNADVTSNTSQQQRGQASTLAALRATQRSTASLGKFDRLREGEPERDTGRRPKKKVKTTTTTTVDEQTRSLQVLKGMSGGVAAEKARKQGRLAKGETAYDFDYDDGLGPSTFRKKKGRAGAGKAKKMTKKRAK